MRRMVIAPILGMMLLFLGVAIVQAEGPHTLFWYVIGGGGGQMQDSGHTLQGTIGQPLAGQSASGGQTLYAGFWNPAMMTATEQRRIGLVSSWNLVSLPLAPTNTAITQTLASINGMYDLVYAYDAAAATPWKKYNTAAPPFLNTLTTISETQGLWIRANSAVSLTITGTLPTNPAIALRAGWNLVGYPSQTTRPVTEALASIDGKYDLVYAYDAGSPTPWKKYNTSAPTFLNTLKELGPGWGYWIRAKEDCVWMVP